MHAYEMHAREMRCRQTDNQADKQAEMHAYHACEIHVYDMASGRCTPVRDTLMGWPMEDAHLA
jgi:hypothetical protein